MQVTENIHAFLWESMTVNNCNTYLVKGERNVLIDPGHAAYFDHVHNGLQELGLGLHDIDLVVATHAHPDHVEAIRLFDRERTKFAMHPAEWELIEAHRDVIKTLFGIDPVEFMPDFFLQEGDLMVGDLAFDVIHTPGHSPGGICLYFSAQKALFTGDLIFAEGLGRTDLPGGDGALLKQSIRKVSSLDTEYLLCGHGGIVKGKKAVMRNFKEVEAYWFAYIS